MQRAWKWKAILALFSVALATWYLIPNLVADDETIAKGPPPPKEWWEKILPDSRLRLGLDLKGGIHMVLGIDLRRALMNESDRYIQDLKEYLPKQKEPVTLQTIHREYDSTEIQVQLKSERDRKPFIGFLQSEFNVLQIKSENSKDRRFVLDITDQRKTEVEKQTVNQALTTLRQRLDEFGVAEPSIQARGNDRIIIQLPGMDDPERAKNVIGRTAQLEFKIVDDETMDIKQVEVMVQEAKAKLPANFKVADLNLALKDKLPAGTQILFKEERDPSTGEVIRMPLLMKAQTLLTGELLEDARIGVDQDNMPTVNLTFNTRGALIVEKVTGDNVNKRLAIILDDKVQSDPVIKQKIAGGRPQITFGALKSRQELLKEAKDLALVLRAGALPAPVEVLQNSVVGPSLGRDSIEKGFKAMLVGVLLVVLFMGVYYRVSGIAADVAVLVNVLFILATLAALHATLTLPGIAGIIISVGMAVDANVIIYERIREELKAGKPIKSAVEAGYDRAHLTIIDSNLTTALTALVLLQYGTGPIKGFAITLIFGLIANYFTALWFTRLAYDWILVRFNPTRLSI